MKTFVISSKQQRRVGERRRGRKRVSERKKGEGEKEKGGERERERERERRSEWDFLQDMECSEHKLSCSSV